MTLQYIINALNFAADSPCDGHHGLIILVIQRNKTNHLMLSNIICKILNNFSKAFTDFEYWATHAHSM